MSNASGGPLSQNSLHLQQAIVAEWVNVRLCPVRNTLLTYFYFLFFFRSLARFRQQKYLVRFKKRSFHVNHVLEMLTPPIFQCLR